MPIFEFRCAACGEIFEKLLMNREEQIDMSCPRCRAETVERVVSRTNYSIGVGPGGNQPKITAKSCGDSSHCMTLDLPGHAR